MKNTRLAPRLHFRACAGIGFVHAFTGVVWVWSDAIPQRNCSRFSRLSPGPEKINKELRTFSTTSPMQRSFNAYPCAAFAKGNACLGPAVSATVAKPGAINISTYLDVKICF
jgi:hypothetical protein